MEKRYFDWQVRRIVEESKVNAARRDKARELGDEESRCYYAGFLGGMHETLRMLGFSREFAEDGSLEGFE